MMSAWLAGGAVCCALSIVAGAFGAHGLESRLEASDLQNWETGARYLMYGGLGLMIMSVRSGSGAVAGPWPQLSLLVGVVVFSGTLFCLSLGAPRWFGAITPLGGIGMILGFALFAWNALRS